MHICKKRLSFWNTSLSHKYDICTLYTVPFLSNAFLDSKHEHLYQGNKNLGLYFNDWCPSVPLSLSLCPSFCASLSFILFLLSLYHTNTLFVPPFLSVLFSTFCDSFSGHTVDPGTPCMPIAHITFLLLFFSPPVKEKLLCLIISVYHVYFNTLKFQKLLHSSDTVFYAAGWCSNLQRGDWM